MIRKVRLPLRDGAHVSIPAQDPCMSLPNPDPFREINGITFWWQNLSCAFRADRLENGHGTIGVFNIEDDLQCIFAELTVRMPKPVELAGDELLVDAYPAHPDPDKVIRFTAMRLRIFRATGNFVEQTETINGHWKRHEASIWQFATCDSSIVMRDYKWHGRAPGRIVVVKPEDRPRHVRRYPKHRGHGGYRVSCLDCRTALEQAHEDARDDWRAKDAVKRLGG